MDLPKPAPTRGRLLIVGFASLPLICLGISFAFGRGVFLGWGVHSHEAAGLLLLFLSICSVFILNELTKSYFYKFRVPLLITHTALLFVPPSFIIAVVIFATGSENVVLYLSITLFALAASMLVAWPRARATTRIEKGAPEKARKLAADYLNRIANIAEKFDLVGEERWLSDFAIGFIDAHIVQAQLRANEDAALRWQHGDYPWEMEARRLFASLVPEIFGLSEGLVDEAFDRTRSYQQDPDSEFITGVLAANRILLKIEAEGAEGTDRHTMRVQELVRSFTKLPGQPWFTVFLPRSTLPRLYEYLVVKTLGQDAFGIQMSDAQLARMLGLGR
jgi:hypothetical protein